MKTLVLAIPAIILMMAGPAYAQDPLRNAYGGAANVVTEVAAVAGSGGVSTVTATAPEILDSIEAAGVDAAGGVAGSGGAGSATTPSAEGSIGAPRGPQVKTSALDSLPFTGLDALLLLLGGTVLFAVGVGMRRLQ